MDVLLDTCAVIWAVGRSSKLSAVARDLLRDVSTNVFVSPVNCAEIACAAERKKLSLDRHWKVWFRDAVLDNGWSVLPIDVETVEEAYSLPGTFHADPADRLIVATARLQDFTIITGDDRILSYPHVRSMA